MTEASVDPVCYDAEGSRTLLLVNLREEELRAKGKLEAEIKAHSQMDIRRAASKHPASRDSSICFRARTLSAILKREERCLSRAFDVLCTLVLCTLYDRERPGIRIRIGRNDALSVVAWRAGRNDDRNPSAIGATG